MTRILITGASGLLGRSVLREFRNVHGWTVQGTARHRVSGDLVRLDLCDFGAVTDCVRALRPQVIIHAAAERRPDVSEKDPESTRRLNVDATRQLAELARALDAWLVYLSSDYLFDGTHPPYRPDAPPHPINAYGQSKLAGEQAALTAPNACSLRVPILYGRVESLDESPVTLIARSLLAPARPVQMEHWATRYPTFTDDVAVVLRQMTERHLAKNDMRGVFHWSGAEPMTKYGMGCVMADVLGVDRTGLTPDPRPPAGAPRPRDCHLDCAVLEGFGIGRRTPFRTAIREVLQPFMDSHTRSQRANHEGE